MQESIRITLDSLAPNEKGNWLTLISSFPTKSNLIQTLINLSTAQLKLAFGKKQHVAIVGPTNVGKSTLYNQFIRSKDDHAAVSAVPGTTKANSVADAGLFAVIDTPGADALGPTGTVEQEQAMEAAEKADFLIILFDAIQGIKKNELFLFRQLIGMGKPYLVCMNKIDLVKHEAKSIIEIAARNLGVKPSQILPISAKDGDNIANVLMAIAITEPEIVAAMGQALPQYRWRLVWRSIVSAATISAVIALTPIPIIDFIPLTATQSIMVLGIARIYSVKLTLARARELIFTFGLGLLARTLFYEMSKFVGIPGWLLAAAIATSTTIVLGYSAAIWFERGQKLTPRAARELTKTLTQTMIGSLKSMGSKRPKKEVLKEQIIQTLEESPLAADREVLDMSAQTIEETNGGEE